MADAKKKPAKKKPAKKPNFFWAPGEDGTPVKVVLIPPPRGGGKIDPRRIRKAIGEIIAEDEAAGTVGE